MFQFSTQGVLSWAGVLAVVVSSLAFAEETGPIPPAVTVAVAQETDMLELVPISGTLVAREEIMVYPQISGALIEELIVDVADLVRKDDVLATLDSKAIVAELTQAKANLASAQAVADQAKNRIAATNATLEQASVALERAQTLLDKGIGTQASLDQAITSDKAARASAASARDGLIVAQAQAIQARAQLDIAELKLDHATIRAPERGVISARAGKTGAIATAAGDPIFKIIKDAEVEMEAEVTETVIGKVSVGDPVQVDVTGIGPMYGSVRRLAPTVDPVTRLGLLRVTLDTEGGLHAGVFATGHVIVEQRSGLSVPTTAVLSDDEGSYVLVARDGILKKQMVTAGLIWKNQREITEGLAAGDLIIARAGAFFQDGDRITPILPDEAEE